MTGASIRPPARSNAAAHRRAFTLIETLAAVAMLAMLTAAVVPIILQLGRGERGMGERWLAQQALRAIAQRADPGENQGPAPFPGHPGWWLVSTELTGSEPPGPGLAPTDIVAHHWRRLAIVTAADGSGTPVAEMLVAEIPAVAAPQHGHATP